ncbi:MAG TPA: hypothetical protein VD814_06585 [Nocardioides sp.]|nr:hypothetical protein [Nocardioides sp.]
MADGGSGLPRAATAFRQHFTHPLYEDVADGLAPFGSDEGNQLLLDWAERRDELDDSSSLATVLECAPDAVERVAGPMEGVDGIETASFVASAAFVLLRLVGHLDEADRQRALAALDFQIGILPVINPGIREVPEVLRIQHEDLASWRNPD